MGLQWYRTPEQDAFLQQKLLEFPDARDKNRVEKFNANLFESWFALFPERQAVFGKEIDLDTLTEEEQEKLRHAIEKRKKQLTNFIGWRATPEKRKNRAPRRKISTLEDLLGGRKKGAPRMKRVVDIYSSMFWDTKVGPEVKRLMAETKPVEPETKNQLSSRHLKNLHKAKKDLWEKEPEETRRLVEEERARLMEERNNEGSDSEHDGDGRDLEGKEAQRLKVREKEISSLAHVLDNVSKDLYARTGFVMTILVGGIRPNGRMQSAMLHVGKTLEGDQNFPTSTEKFEEKITEPWNLFLERAFPPSQQRAQAEHYKKVFNIPEAIREPAPPLETEVWSTEKQVVGDQDQDPEDVQGYDEQPSHPDKESGKSTTTSPIPSAAETLLPSSKLYATVPNTNPSLALDKQDNPTGLWLPSSNESEPQVYGSFMEQFHDAVGDEGSLTKSADHASLLHQNFTTSNCEIGPMDSPYWTWIGQNPSTALAAFNAIQGPGINDAPLHSLVPDSQINSFDGAVNNSMLNVTLPTLNPGFTLQHNANPKSIGQLTNALNLEPTVGVACGPSFLSTAPGMRTESSAANIASAPTLSTDAEPPTPPSSVVNAGSTTSPTSISTPNHVDPPSATVSPSVPVVAATSGSKKKPSVKKSDQCRKQPLQPLNITTEISSKRSARNSKRKMHPDEVFQQQQALREMKQNKRAKR